MAVDADAESHGKGTCGLKYVSDAFSTEMLSCGQDGRLALRAPGKATISNVNHIKDVQLHCLDAHAKSGIAAVGDGKNFVKIYKLPSLEFEKVATRFQLPVRAVAFSPCGLRLAAAGDDDGIKLVHVADGKVYKTLRAGPYTRALAFEQEGTHLASLSADGHLQVWDVATGKSDCNMPKSAPKVDRNSHARGGLAWHPDGSLLAVAGTSNNIVIYERLSWDPLHQLDDAHLEPVNCLEFSPNGLYLASGGRDKKLVVWDVEKKEVLSEKDLDAVPVSLAWHPAAKNNTLASIGEDGAIRLWNSVIPSHMLTPSAPLDDPSPRPAHSQEVSHEPEASHGSMMDGSEAAGHGVEDEDEASRGADEESPNKAARAAEDAPRKATVIRKIVGPRLPQLQPAIHSASTTSGEGKKRWLAYNLLGGISSREDDDFCAVEVSFHDATQHRRVPLLTDFYHFSMASLSAAGTFYASQSSADAPSMLAFKPFDSWAPGSDWTLGLPQGEEAVAVAAGATFCAAVTSKQCLRIFSISGVQTGVIAVAGRPVALAAQDDQLALVWHGAMPLADGDQALQYAVYRVSGQSVAHAGPLYLSGLSQLAWLGFSEAGLLAAHDTEGIMRVRSPAFGGSWVPVFDAATQCSASQSCWPVGLDQQSLYCIIGPAAQPSPQVHPRPVLSVLDLQAAVIGFENEFGRLESQLLCLQTHLSHLRDVEGVEGASAALQSQIQDAEDKVDKKLLRMFQSAVKGEKVVRALEVASQLTAVRSLEGALKLANHHRMSALAERVQCLIQDLEEQALEATFEEMKSPAGHLSRFAPESRLEVDEAQAGYFDTGSGVAARNSGSQALRELSKANQDRRSPLQQRAATKAPVSPAEKRKMAGANPFAKKAKAAVT